MPLIRVNPDHVAVVGTAFTIAPGVMMTARHIITDDLLKFKTQFEAGKARVYAQYRAKVGERVLVGMHDVERFDWNPQTDLALFSVGVPDVDGVPLESVKVRLRLGPPPVGTLCLSLGTDTSAEVSNYEEGEIRFHTKLLASSGVVTALRPNGVGAWPFQFPHFDITAEYPFKMSGGPIIGASGEVFGVVSTCMDGQEGVDPLSRGAFVYSALGLKAKIRLPGSTEPTEMTLLEMAQNGIVETADLDRIIVDPVTGDVSVPSPG